MPADQRRRARPSVVVLGDLMLDVVLAPSTPLRLGTDVPGRVTIHQGGSAANTARWLGWLGVRTQLICSVGRDLAGRTLVDAVRSDGVTVRATRTGTARTGRIGVVVTAGGERSFVADRAAADRLSPADLDPRWFASADLLHVPVYSLLGEPLGQAGRAAVRLARATGALVSLDLASVGPLLAGGREAAFALVGEVAPDLLLATATELRALLGSGAQAEGTALDLAPLVAIKRGASGVSVLARSGQPARFDVATQAVAALDTTGAGDAFDAGFIAEWLASRSAGRASTVSLRRAAVVGNRLARRQVAVPRRELRLG
jgi:sugar/nucleoside kinase (ribokinase family)